eukprot:scaffold8683_cov104-Isochrysis_galbana.AAC.5
MGQLAAAVEAVHTSSERRDAEQRAHADAQLAAVRSQLAAAEADARSQLAASEADARSQLAAAAEVWRGQLEAAVAAAADEARGAAVVLRRGIDETRDQLSQAILLAAGTTDTLLPRVERLEEAFLVLGKRLAVAEAAADEARAEAAELRAAIGRCALREEVDAAAGLAFREAAATALAGTHRAWEAGMASLGSDFAAVGGREPGGWAGSPGRQILTASPAEYYCTHAPQPLPLSRPRPPPSTPPRAPPAAAPGTSVHSSARPPQDAAYPYSPACDAAPRAPLPAPPPAPPPPPEPYLCAPQGPPHRLWSGDTGGGGGTTQPAASPAPPPSELYRPPLPQPPQPAPADLTPINARTATPNTVALPPAAWCHGPPPCYAAAADVVTGATTLQRRVEQQLARCSRLLSEGGGAPL